MTLTGEYLSFAWQETESLAAKLQMPITRMSVWIEPHHNRPVSATLWHPDGTGLRVQSVMHDIAERIEVGVLDFTLTRKAEIEERTVALPKGMEGGPLSVEKLSIREAGITAESGVALSSGNGDDELIIVAGVYPYTLAIRGIGEIPHIFEPEYSLEKYARVDLRTAGVHVLP